MKTTAEVTPEVFESVKAALYQAEITGPRAGASLDALATAAITALTVAGFGLVADAKREALEESAAVFEKYAKNAYNNNPNLDREFDALSDGWRRAANRLRAMAAAVRGEG